MKSINCVNPSHFCQIEGDAIDYPQMQLEQDFLKCFSDSLAGNVAFSKVKNMHISDSSNEAAWITGMNSIIILWNSLLPEPNEEVIRQAFQI